MELVSLLICTSRIQAEVVRSLLEAHEIECFVSADDGGGMRPFPFQYSPSVRIMVSEYDFRDAQYIISSVPDRSS